MQLVTGGPYLPPKLLAALERGQLVFFCGAGISMPMLPGFPKLVKRVREALHQPPEAPGDTEYERHLYRIERAVGSTRMRQALARALRPPRRCRTDVHEAILRLARVGDGPPRLVTTNFDGLFDIAARNLRLRIANDAAPRLLRPDPDRWRSITYLHGRIGNGSALDELVATSADYGRGYLTDGFAGRFLIHLFGNFDVLFVGYSASDPPMRYLLDALASERAMEARAHSPPTPTTHECASASTSERRTHQVWAFADHHGDNREVVRNWLDRGVEPIPFLVRGTCRDPDYSLLNDTLVELANRRDSGLAGRRKVVREATRDLAPRAETLGVQQALFYLNEAACAEVFADAEPPPPVDWLALLDGRSHCKGLASGALIPPTGGARWHLARWLAGHLPRPEAVDWIIAQGGVPGLELAHAIDDRLRGDAEIPDAARRVLCLLLEARRSTAPASFGAAYQFSEKAKPFEVVEALVAGFEPVVRLQSAARWRDPSYGRGPGAPDPTSVSWFVEAEIEPRSPHVAYLTETNHEKPDFQAAAAAAAHRLAGRLEEAVALHALAGRELWLHRGRIQDASYEVDYRPAWSVLVALLRDLASGSEQSVAESLLLRWQLHPATLLQRLAAHVLGHHAHLPGERLMHFILSASRLGDTALETEMPALLSSAWRKAGSSQRRQLLKAVQAKPVIDHRDWDFVVQRRLQWMAAAGGPGLPKAIARKIAHLTPEDGTRESPDQAIARLRPHGDSDIPSEALAGKAGAEIADLLRQKPGRGDALRAFIPDHPDIAAELARFLQDSGEWLPEAWHAILVGLADSKGETASAARVAVRRTLDSAPAWFLEKENWGIAHFLKRTWGETKAAPGQDECATWDRAFRAAGASAERAFAIRDDSTTVVSSSREGSPADRSYSMAVNNGAGILAESVLNRLWMSSPRPGQGLREPERMLLSGVCDGMGPAHRMARIAIARWIELLFALDPAWTARYLIPHFDPTRETSSEVWCAFLHGPSISPDLFAALQPYYLHIPGGPAGITEPALLDNFYQRVVFAAIDVPGLMSKDAAQTFLRAAGTAGLARVAAGIDRKSEDTEEKGARLWRSRILPWLKATWPKERNLRSERATEFLASAALAAGSEITSVSDFVSGIAAGLTGPLHLLRRLRRGQHSALKAHPTQVLSLISLIVDLKQRWLAQDLRLALEAIAEAAPDLRNDARWKRLDALAANRQAGG